MSTFKFNFSTDDCNEPSPDDRAKTISSNIEWLTSEQVSPTSQLQALDAAVRRAHMFTCGDFEIGHIIASDALKTFTEASDVARAEELHSDLVTGKYEGGLKIWECTSDLLEYLLGNIEREKWRDGEVLDLGCGAGLLGIMALLCGARVVFQDYNKEVLESVTIPNVLINLDDEEKETEIAKCKFYSGDWASFEQTLETSRRFDFILTSETIYNCENYEKLINIFSSRLKDGGSVFVAAKTYYFGVGGGTRQFEAVVQKSDLKSEVCWKSSGGIQREILKITRK